MVEEHKMSSESVMALVYWDTPQRLPLPRPITWPWENLPRQGPTALLRTRRAPVTGELLNQTAQVILVPGQAIHAVRRHGIAVAHERPNVL